jgi:hypothetical protein
MAAPFFTRGHGVIINPNLACRFQPRVYQFGLSPCSDHGACKRVLGSAPRVRKLLIYEIVIGLAQSRMERTLAPALTITRGKESRDNAHVMAGRNLVTVNKDIASTVWILFG